MSDRLNLRKFIGRENEVNYITENALKDKCVHLSFHGMPHVGKTWLVSKWNYLIEDEDHGDGFVESNGKKRALFIVGHQLSEKDSYNDTLVQIIDKIKADFEYRFSGKSITADDSDTKLDILKKYISFYGDNDIRTVLELDEFQYISNDWEEDEYIEFMKMLLDETLDLMCITISRPKMSIIIENFLKKINPFESHLVTPFTDDNMKEFFSRNEKKLNLPEDEKKQKNFINQILYYCGRNPFLLNQMVDELIVSLPDNPKITPADIYKNTDINAKQNDGVSIFQKHFSDVADYMVKEKSLSSSFSSFIKCYFGTSLDNKELIEQFRDLGYIELSDVNSPYNYVDDLHEHLYVEDALDEDGNVRRNRKGKIIKNKYYFYTVCPAFLDYIYITKLSDINDTRDLITGLVYCIRDITKAGLKKEYRINNNSWNTELLKRLRCKDNETDRNNNERYEIYNYADIDDKTKPQNAWKWVIRKDNNPNFSRKNDSEFIEKINNNSMIDISHTSFKFALIEFNKKDNKVMPVLDAINMIDNGLIIKKYPNQFKRYLGSYFDLIGDANADPFSKIKEARDPLSHFSRYSLDDEDRESVKEICVGIIKKVYTKWGMETGHALIVNDNQEEVMESESSINKQDKPKQGLFVAKHIVPFRLEKNYKDVCDDLLISNDWMLKEKPDAEQDVYEYIANSLYVTENDIKNGSNNIGSFWRIKDVSTYAFPDIKYHDIVTKEKYAIVFTGAELAIFKNGIGFFIYDVQLKNINSDGSISEFVTDQETLLRFQNKFKELNRLKIKEDKDELFWDFIRLSDESEGRFVMGQWIYEVLTKEIGKVRFYPERSHCLANDVHTSEEVKSKIKDMKLPDKSILFSYVILDTKDHYKRNEYAFRMGLGYNNNYMLPKGFADDMFMPFGNITWKVSKEGCVCVASNVGKENIGFLFNIFIDKVRGDYFLLYLLLLHQSYSLLMYAEKIENELPAEPSYYIKNAEDSCIQNMLTDINTFLLKGTHVSVSHIQHQNSFYNYGAKSLRIDEDTKSVIAGAEAILDMQKVVEEDEASKKEKRLNIALAFISIFTIVSTITDIMTFVDDKLFGWRADRNIEALHNIPWYANLSAALLFAPLFGVIALIIWIWYTNRKKK